VGKYATLDAAMAKQLPKSLNLLHETGKPVNTWDKIYTWVFAVGRYVIIGVELIVLLGFVARFSLDRQRNDLKDSIDAKVGMLEAQTDVEANLRRVQATLASFSSMIENQKIISTQFNKIQGKIPSDVDVSSFSISQTSIGISCSAPSYEVVQGFESDLRDDPDYSSVKISLKKSGSGDTTVEFDVSISYAEEDL